MYFIFINVYDVLVYFLLGFWVDGQYVNDEFYGGVEGIQFFIDQGVDVGYYFFICQVLFVLFFVFGFFQKCIQY